ncbi:MAG: hypothetical protein QNJ42_19145 [Crocosphaera sp.]|nr:hypothetical protein [Crocosphaera sp.]
MNKPIPKIDIDGLTEQQIEQIQTIITSFKQQNELELKKSQSKGINQSQPIDDIFFESDILQTFNRSMLYGKRISTNIS